MYVAVNLIHVLPYVRQADVETKQHAIESLANIACQKGIAGSMICKVNTFGG